MKVAQIVRGKYENKWGDPKIIATKGFSTDLSSIGHDD